MKKALLIFTTVIMSIAFAHAQAPWRPQLAPAVQLLDRAVKAKDYGQLAVKFSGMAAAQKTNWLSWYYAAFCNAKLAWLNEKDPGNIERLANKAEKQIKKAGTLLDTATQKKELSEMYCILSLLNWARVFIDPGTYGRKYGPRADYYLKMALSRNASNPRALYLEGWEKYTTPKVWGGDTIKAKQLLQEAKQKLDEAATNTARPHWGRKEVEELLNQLK